MSGDSVPERVALLVVHGIGEQKPMATVDKVLHGLQGAHGHDLAIGARDMGRRSVELGLRGSDTRVITYEVFWADLFADGARGSFTPEAVQPMALFPFLNRRHGLYPERRSWWRVVLATLILLPAALLAYTGLLGAKALGGAWYGFQRKGTARRPLRDRIRGILKPSTPYGIVDQVLDTVPGDIVQYVAGSAPCSPAGTRADAVRDRVYEQLDAARQDGCTRVCLLAHSLGTVIAFHALSGYRHEGERAQVSYLWTIGSPLEKIAYFFPTMADGAPIGGAPPRWVNFRNPLDVVAGRLRSFPAWNVTNRRVWSGGIGRSHTIYETNALVVDALTCELFGVSRPVRVSLRLRAFGVAAALLESLGVLLALAIPVVLGVLALSLGLLLLPWAVGTAVGFFASDATESAVKSWSVLVVGTLYLFMIAVFTPVSSATKLHRAWRPKPTAPRTDPKIDGT